MKKYLYLLVLPLMVSCKPATVDSKGGLRITIKPSTEILDDISDDIEVLKNRVSRQCKNNPQVKFDVESGNIIMELPKETESDKYNDLILARGNFGMFEVYDNEFLSETFFDINKVILENNCYGLIDTVYMDSVLKVFPLFSMLYPLYSHDNKPRPGGALGHCEFEDTSVVNQILLKPEVKSQFPANAKFYWSYLPVSDVYALYAIKLPVDYTAISANMIKSARHQINQNIGLFEVSMRFKAEYCDTWSELTRNNISKPLAVVFDNAVYSCPIVMAEINGGAVTLSGDFTEDNAKTLAYILQSGELKNSLTIEKVEYVEK